MKCGLKGKPCFLRRKQRWLQTALTATWYRVLIDIGIDMSYSFHLVAVFAESSSSALQLAVCMLLGSSGIGRQQWPKNTRSHGPHRSAIETDTRFWSIDQENKKGVYGILCGPSRDKKMIFCITGWHNLWGYRWTYEILKSYRWARNHKFSRQKCCNCAFSRQKWGFYW